MTATDDHSVNGFAGFDVLLAEAARGDDPVRYFFERLAEYNYPVFESGGSEKGHRSLPPEKRKAGFEGWTFCPTHELEGAHDPSVNLKITKEGRVLVYCHGGCGKQYRAFTSNELEECSAEYRVKPRESRWREDGRFSDARRRSRIEITTNDEALEYAELANEDFTETIYEYVGYTERGNRVDLRKVRWPDKLMRWYYEYGIRHNDVWGGFRRGHREDVVRVDFYGAHRLTEGLDTVWATEGEKDADTLNEKGFRAVAFYSGLGEKRHTDDCLEIFRGEHVVLCQDNDKTGAKLADKFAHRVSSVAASVKILPPFGSGDGYDVTDWFETDGGTVDALREMAKDAPVYVAPETPYEPEEHEDEAQTEATNTESAPLTVEAITGTAMYRDKYRERLIYHVADRNAKNDLQKLSQHASGDKRELTDGASFILDDIELVPTLWGDPSSDISLWSPGEALCIAGPQGAAKSTLAQNIALRRIGVIQSPLLGYTVLPDETDGKLLYLALDRPRQIHRSLARMVTEKDRALLNERLVFWPGSLPPHVNVKDPSSFVEWVLSTGANAVFPDSYKDLGVGELGSEEGGHKVNNLIQACLASGIEWLGLHHHRKANAQNKKPKKLADLYGSVWITAGSGSVIQLWNNSATSTTIEVEQLKAPATPLETINVELDRRLGALGIAEDIAVKAGTYLWAAGAAGVPEAVLTEAVCGENTRANRERLQRHLANDDRFERVAGARGGQGSPPLYRRREVSA